MEQIVKDIIKIVTKHQIQSDSYDCEELEADLLKILNLAPEPAGLVINWFVTSTGIKLVSLTVGGQVKHFVNNKEVASWIYEAETNLSSERLEILFLNK